MREVDVGSGKALLIKDADGFHAIGHKCSHYGAPLCKGMVFFSSKVNTQINIVNLNLIGLVNCGNC